jgi:hypothetical protein
MKSINSFGMKSIMMGAAFDKEQQRTALLATRLLE